MENNQDPIKRKKLYDYLNSEGMTELSYNDFSQEYANNSQKNAELFNYLSKEQMTTLTIDKFQQEYFGDVKKKETSQSTSQGSQSALGGDASGVKSISGSDNVKLNQEQTGSLESTTVSNYKNWKESTKVTDEDKESIRKTIDEELNPDTFDKIGLYYNKFADTFNDFFATDPVAGMGGTLGEDLNILPQDTNAYNYIKDELEEADKVLSEEYKDSKPSNYKDLVKEKAIELKQEQLSNSLIQKKRRNFLNELPSEEREKLFDYAENSLIDNDERMSDLIQSMNLIKKDTEETIKDVHNNLSPIAKRMQEIKSMTFSDNEWATTEEQRVELKSELSQLQEQAKTEIEKAENNGVLVDITDGKVRIGIDEEASQEYEAIRSELEKVDRESGTLEEELDLFNRSYNMFTVAGAKTLASGMNVVGGMADMQAMYDKEIIAPIVENVPLLSAINKVKAKAAEGISNRLSQGSESLRSRVQKDVAFSDVNSLDDSLTYLLSTTGETLPYLIAYASNPVAGATTIGTSATGNRYRQIQQEIEEGAEYGKGQIISSSLISGTSEAMLGFIPSAKRLRGFQKVTNSVSNDTYKSGVRSAAKKIWGTVKSGGAEGLEESGVKIIENFTDSVILEKEGVGIFDEITEPFAAGTSVGLLLPATGAVTGFASRAITAQSKKARLKKNADRAIELEERMAKNDLSDKSLEVIKSEYLDLLKENRDIILKSASDLTKATKEEFSELKRIDKDMKVYSAEAREIRNNTELDVDSKIKVLKELKQKAKSDLESKERILEDLSGREAPITSEQKAERVSDLLGRPVTLTKFGDFELDTPVEGEMYVEGQTIVLEKENGDVLELGNVNEISDKTVEEAGVVQQVSEVKVNSEGEVIYKDTKLVPDDSAIKRNKRGDISSVVLRNEQGDKTVTLRGRNAEDAAYQILLNKAQTENQNNRINEILQRDEEFQNELRKTEDITKEQTDKDTRQDIEQERMVTDEKVGEVEENGEVSKDETSKNKEREDIEKRREEELDAYNPLQNKFLRGNPDGDSIELSEAEYMRVNFIIDKGIKEGLTAEQIFEKLRNANIRRGRVNASVVLDWLQNRIDGKSDLRAGENGGKKINDKYDAELQALSETRTAPKRNIKPRKAVSDSKKSDFELAQEKVKKRKDIANEAKKAKKGFKKNRGKKYVPDDGSLARALSVDTSLLDEQQLQEFSSLVESVKDNRFEYSKNEPLINKYAEIFADQPKIDEVASEEKEVDPDSNADLINEFKIKQNFPVNKVKKSLLNDVADLKTVKESELEGLSKTDLEVLNTNLDQVSSGGEMNARTRDIIGKIRANRNVENTIKELNGKAFRVLMRGEIGQALDKLQGKNVKGKARLNRLQTRVGRTPLRDLDNALKGDKSGKLFKYLGVEGIAKSYDAFANSLNKGVVAKVSDVFSSISKKDAKTRTNAKIYLIHLQKIQDLNDNVDGDIFSVMDYMVASQRYTSQDSDYRKEFDIVKEVYREIPKRSDGTIDVDKAIESLDSKQKEIHEMIESHHQGEGKDMSIDVATMEGKTPKTYAYYAPINVKGKKSDKLTDLSAVKKEAEKFRKQGLYQGELGSLIERTGQVNPLDFNYVQKFRSNTNRLNRKFYMYPKLQEFNATFNKLLSDKELNEDTRNFLEAVRNTVVQVHDNTFAGAYYVGDSLLAKLGSRISEIGYYNQLASVTRASVELVSNLSNAMILEPASFNKGMNILLSRDKNTSFENIEFLFNLMGSPQSSRLFVNSTSIMREVETGADTKTSFKEKNSLGKMYDKSNQILLSSPDRATALPLAVGSFFRKYEELSGGKSIDIERLKSDNQYFLDNKPNLEEAMRASSEILSQSASSLNPFESTPASQINPEDRANILKIFDKYMTRFQLAEFSSIIKGVDALKGDRQDMSQTKGAALIAATLFRMGLYNVGMQYGVGLLYDTVMGAFGRENKYDDDEERTVSNIIYNESISALANVFIMRRLGNINKIFTSSAIESINVMTGESLGLRKSSDYNSYRDALTYSIVPRDDKGDVIYSAFALKDKIFKLTGPYQSFIESFFDVANSSYYGGFYGVTEGKSKSFETQKKYQDRLNDAMTKLFLASFKTPAPREFRKLMNYEFVRGEVDKMSDKEYRNLEEIKKGIEERTGREFKNSPFKDRENYFEDRLDYFNKK